MNITTDTHAHTIASTHAYSTVQELAAAAKVKGLKMFAITDHGPAMPDSPHDWHFGNMRVIPRVIDGVGILRGIEANIMSTDGSLDLPPYPGLLDLVIASFHTPVIKPTTKSDHTKALINTICSGLCHIIGHPGNPAYPIDVDEIILAAKDHNVVLEINNSSFSLSRQGSSENCRHILERVAHHNWKVSFGSDAHFSSHLGEFTSCISIAEKVGFSAENIISANPESLLGFLAEHGNNLHNEFLPAIPVIS